jgi:hypothetical protein
MKYTVHIYAVVRVPVDVEADSPEEAIKKTDDFDLHSGFMQGEYSENVTGYMVDEIDEQGNFIRECGDYSPDGEREEVIQ